MAVFEIPTADGTLFPSYRIEVELDGVVFKIDLRVNSRQGSWFMDIRDLNSVIIRTGISVVCGIPLMQRVKQQSRPAGSLLAVPVSDDTISAASLEQLGADVILTYTGDS